LEFWRFQTIDKPNYFLLEGEYNYFLVGLSILISGLAAYALLFILERIWNTHSGSTIRLWKGLGSAVFGLGVWAMHFTGMLAFMLHIDMSYNIPITLLSVVPPMLGAFVACSILATKTFTFINIQLSALCLALGIGSMHFLGMEAMQIDGEMTYDFALFVASIACAHLLAVIAIYLVVHFYNSTSHKFLPKLLSALIMGLSIAGMHYVAMIAVQFHADNNVLLASQDMSNNAVMFGLMIATIVFIIVAITIFVAIVDKRMQATESLLQASVTREQDIVENLADGLIVIDQDGMIDSVNFMGLKMFDYEQLSLQNCRITQLMPSFDFLQLSSSMNSSEESAHTIVMDGVKRDEQYFPVEVNFSAKAMQVGGKSLFHCVVRDISRRVQLEEQLQQAKKLESIGQLAAGIAHEINTPTQYVSDNTTFIKDASQTCLSIIASAQLIIDSNNDKDKQENIEKLRALMKAGDIDFISNEIPLAIDQSLEGLQRISKIVGAMKSFSHSSNNAMQQVDIAAAIESTAIVARGEWRYVAELKMTFDDLLPLVTCFRDQINQVVLNFIVNAAHAIQSIFCESGHPLGLISSSATQEHDNLVISIADNGIGMSKEVQQRIFDPFFTTKGVGKGTGQGLSLAYHVIVETHKGQILVDSTPDVHTTFKIILPLTEPEQKIA
jgi:PAS domain S-box-containing protein